MNTAGRSEFLQVLQGRCDTIADNWYQAIARTSDVPHSPAAVRQHLGGLTEQVIAFLLTNPLEHGWAEAIGAALARLDHTEPEVLGRTQELLAWQLVQGLPADRVVALHPRLAALLGGLAAGFFQQARQAILTEHERIRKALIGELQRTAEALRKVRDKGERRVQERTVELAGVNKRLRREIAECKRVEEALRKAHEELEQRVERHTAELTIANEELKREMEECKRAKEALRESEDTARALLNAPTDAAALMDTRGIILDANETMANRFHRRMDELIGSCIWDLFPSDVSERRKAHVNQVIQSGKPVRFEDDREGMWNDNVIYPVLDAQGKVTKVAVLARDITERRRAEEQVRAARERLRQLTQQIVSTQEEERQRLSRALHDEAGQALTALKIGLELIEEDLPAEFGSLRQRISDAAALADATMEQIRSLAQDLRPPALDTVGLGPTLEGFCRDFAGRTQLSIECVGVEPPMLPEAVNICLYRFLQEALTNVAKHACAKQVCVVLRCDADKVTLSVEDDGRGFDGQARLSVSGWPMGIGLLGMQERLESLGGRLEIASQPGLGTRLVAHLPVEGMP